MIDSQKILALIESVNPDDGAALDELDVKISLFLGHPLPRRYTRSRDVLKNIRPEGFLVKIELWPSGPSVMGCFVQEDGGVTPFESGGGPTEEI